MATLSVLYLFDVKKTRSKFLLKTGPTLQHLFMSIKVVWGRDCTKPKMGAIMDMPCGRTKNFGNKTGAICHTRPKNTAMR